MELVLPSSPVWYQTKASDTSIDGYFAFASRSLIYLLDIRQDVPSYFGKFDVKVSFSLDCGCAMAATIICT